MTKRIIITCDICHKDLIVFNFNTVNDYYIYDLFDIICHGCRDSKKLKQGA